MVLEFTLTIKSIINFCFIASSYKDTGAAWVLARNGEVPPNAVVGGREGDVDLYVARFYTKDGHLIPGKLHPRTRRAYNSFGGKELSSDVYQVLTHPDQARQLKWVPATPGAIPTGALQGGQGRSGVLYIARAPHQSFVICGKVGSDKMYVPLNGREITVGEGYEILCVTSVTCD